MPNNKPKRATPDARKHSQRGGRTQKTQQITHVLKIRHNLREKIQACRELALECAGKAETATSEESRDNYLRIEKSWMNLARTYEFAAQLLDDRDAAAFSGFNGDGNSISSRLH